MPYPVRGVALDRRLRATKEEREMAEFQTVGPADIDDGEAEAFDVDGRRIAVANVDGSLHAFDDTCTHMGCSLAQGEMDGNVIECPCHGSRFDVTNGTVVQGPATDPVETFEARMEGSDLQIAL
jgi:nitrite reductase/ring-hydroxylating ferredoxin subunit